jgi:uncharacterized protein YyaL (SSP411 family)
MSQARCFIPAIRGKFLFVLLFLVGCHSLSNKKEDQNHLGDAQSPYLLQHADNPVEWYPWGEEALARAQREDKPLIISIGYAACHWCHVMERESFKNDSIAKFMNEHFINIKVDREERPDIDQIYMNAVQLMTGSGGWPLNAIALPNGEPFFAGTYFTPEQWSRLLSEVNKLYQNDRTKLEETAARVKQGIASSDLIESNDIETTFPKEKLDKELKQILARVDRKNGGFASDQKFPLPMAWEFLLDVGYLTEADSIRDVLQYTLDQMLSGGLYDHIGGGFARYTVDREWRIPHFEKMLYDNAQLMSLFARCFSWTRDSTYLKVVNETTDFLEREMMDSKVPAFYSSIDAESEHEEGAFYVWTWSEINEHFSEVEREWITSHYNWSRKGNWEDGKNIAWQGLSADKIAENSVLNPAEMADTLESLRKKLFQLRSERERPKTDDKILTAWNALVIQAYVDAFKASGDPARLRQAEKTAKFIWSKMKSNDEGALFRSYKNGEARISAFLDDYAYFIESLLELYQVTFDETYLEQARQLTTYVMTHFADRESPFFYYTSAQDEPLIVRKIELVDNVQPASNSVMAHNLYVLGQFLDKSNWIERSKRMLQTIMADEKESGYYYANWYRLYALLAYDLFEVAIVGPDATEKRTNWIPSFYPNVLFLGSEEDSKLPLLEDKWQEGSTIIYVCKEKVCRLPVETVSAARDELESEW